MEKVPGVQSAVWSVQSARGQGDCWGVGKARGVSRHVSRGKQRG